MHILACIPYFRKSWLLVPILPLFYHKYWTQGKSNLHAHRWHQAILFKGQTHHMQTYLSLTSSCHWERWRVSYSRASRGLQPVWECVLSGAHSSWASVVNPAALQAPHWQEQTPPKKPNPCILSFYSVDFSELRPWPHFLFHLLSSYFFIPLPPPAYLSQTTCMLIGVVGDHNTPIFPSWN